MSRHGAVTTSLVLAAGVVAAAGPVSAADAERALLRRVTLTTDARLAQGCTPIGRVKDDEVKDLRRKIVRLGGDTAVVAFGEDDIHADVYRCPPRPSADIPPPPAGVPPPPPPSR